MDGGSGGLSEEVNQPEFRAELICWSNNRRFAAAGVDAVSPRHATIRSTVPCRRPPTTHAAVIDDQPEGVRCLTHGVAQCSHKAGRRQTVQIVLISDVLSDICQMSATSPHARRPLQRLRPHKGQSDLTSELAVVIDTWKQAYDTSWHAPCLADDGRRWCTLCDKKYPYTLHPTSKAQFPSAASSTECTTQRNESQWVDFLTSKIRYWLKT